MRRPRIPTSPGRAFVKPQDALTPPGSSTAPFGVESNALPPLGPQLSQAEIQATFRDGLSALKRGRLAEAEQLLSLTLRRDPDHVPARINLALVFDRRGDKEQALRELRAAARIDGTRPEVYLNLGAVLAEMGRTADAYDYLRRVIQLAPDLFEAHYDLGLLHYRNGQLEEAQPSFERALEIE